jgi:hypothetical protein
MASSAAQLWSVHPVLRSSSIAVVCHPVAVVSDQDNQPNGEYAAGVLQSSHVLAAAMLSNADGQKELYKAALPPALAAVSRPGSTAALPVVCLAPSYCVGWRRTVTAVPLHPQTAPISLQFVAHLADPRHRASRSKHIQAGYALPQPSGAYSRSSPFQLSQAHNTHPEHHCNTCCCAAACADARVGAA